MSDLDAARHFYGAVLGCEEGRSSDQWIDFNLFGHQIVVHLVPGADGSQTTNPVDGHNVPVPHFGVVLDLASFDSLAARLTASRVAFGLAPTTRFKGQAGEQKTMFLFDPSGNALEFKAFADDAMIFAR